MIVALIRTLSMAAGLIVLVLPIAQAAGLDCEGEIQRLQTEVTKVSDAHARRLVEFDITRAKREANEGDGSECKEAVSHADKLLASAALSRPVTQVTPNTGSAAE